MIPFTVALMYHLQQVGDASAFSPSGTKIAFVVKRPLETDRNFARMFLQDDDVADVYVDDLASGRVTKITNGATDGAGFWDPQWSPDGKRIAMLSTRGGNVYLWVWDANRGLRRVTDRAVDMAYMLLPVEWLSNDRLICQLLPAGEQPLSMSVETETPEVAMREWPIDWRGRQSTANVLESGIPVNVARLPQGQLRIIDIGGEGRSRTIASAAHFESLTLSHDRREVAAFLETGVFQPQAHRKLQASFDNGVYQLSVFDARNGATVAHFPRNVVGQASLSWSPNDRQLAIFAQPATTAYAAHMQIYRCDLGTRQCTNALPSTLSVDIGPNGTWRAPLWASGGRILVYAKSSTSGGAPDKQRWDWYAISPRGTASNLTASLSGAPASLVPIEGSRFIGLAGGELVTVFADGRKPKTMGFKGLPAPMNIAWPTNTDVTTRTFVVSAEMNGQQDFFSVDVASGRVVRLGRVPLDAQLNAFYPHGSRAIFAESLPDGSFLRYGADGSSLRTIYAANLWLSRVGEGRSISYSYTSLDGQKLSAWILLPPGAKPGHRYPAVTWVYGGELYNPKVLPFLAHLNLVHALNMQLLAARGYAVIFPSMPLAPFGEPSDPYPKLPNGVLPAIDKAVQLGYVDANRVAVMGQSYGGYSTYALITETNRFKAAIALAGISDWTSLYGMYDGRRRYEDNVNVNDEFDLSLMEEGQGNFGAPPWVDPKRYESNSPLTYVANVHTPLLIIQGDLDYVPIQQGEEFFTALYRQGKRAEFARYWGEEHVFRSEANIEDYWNRIAAWLKEFCR